MIRNDGEAGGAWWRHWEAITHPHHYSHHPHRPHHPHHPLSPVCLLGSIDNDNLEKH